MNTGCAVEDCDRKLVAVGYCGMHYKRFRKNGDPLIARRIRGLVRDDQGRKRCVYCHEWLPESRFGINGNNSDGLGSYCRPCAAAYARFRFFGLTAEDYAALLASQGGVCAICKSTDSGPREWHVDHDHKCCPSGRKTCGRCVRGLLCHRCNTALGGMRDDPTILRAAADYLEAALTRTSAR